MKTELRARNVKLTPTLRERILEKLGLLSRYERQVSSVRVWLEDVSGPRGGVDKRCSIQLRGPLFGALAVEAMHQNPAASFELAMRAAERSVSRAIDRRRYGFTAQDMSL